MVGSLRSPPLRDALFFTAAGLLAYGLSLLAWLAVLVRYRLSYAYPLLALSYVLVYAGATQWPELAEAATPQRTIGTLLILAGVALASLTRGRASHNSKRRDAPPPSGGGGASKPPDGSDQATLTGVGRARVRRGHVGRR